MDRAHFHIWHPGRNKPAGGDDESRKESVLLSVVLLQKRDASKSVNFLDNLKVDSGHNKTDIFKLVKILIPCRIYML